MSQPRSKHLEESLRNIQISAEAEMEAKHSLGDNYLSHYIGRSLVKRLRKAITQITVDAIKARKGVEIRKAMVGLTKRDLEILKRTRVRV